MRSQKLNPWQVSVIIVLTLAMHWFGSHILVQWAGGEANLARGQAPVRATIRVPSYQADDGWRRTSHGWEQINRLTAPAAPLAVTQHFSFGQLWPAAWAVGMVLLICGTSDQLAPKSLRS